MSRVCRLAFCMFLCFCITACQPQEQNGQFSDLRAQRDSDFSPCERTSSTQATSLVSSSKCLIFSVAENPLAPQGRYIPLQVLVLPALNVESSDDAIVVLAGGPGQAASTLVQVAAIFADARQDRDIIFMDQRGTGELSPLQCDFEQIDEQESDLEKLLETQRELLLQCLEQMDADPEFYTTDIAIQDLEKLRLYLGYESFNLWGGSYGTRVALAYLQAYPESTRTVVIDGVAPPSISLPLYMERDASSALELIFSDCMQQLSCAQAYPDLANHFVQLTQGLQESTTRALRNAIDNTIEEIEINSDVFLSLLRAPLYGRETQRLIPFIIEQAYEGNFQPLLAGASSMDAGINQGMYLSVICNEDLTLFNADDLANEKSNQYFFNSDFFSTPTLAACNVWPKRKVPEEYFDPVSSSQPVLIFSGQLDPVTPAIWGDKVEATLLNAHHIVVPGFAHSTFNSSCTINMINDFIEQENFSDLDEGCIENLQRRPFFIESGGAASND